jgi:hypothetical protein
MDVSVVRDLGLVSVLLALEVSFVIRLLTIRLGNPFQDMNLLTVLISSDSILNVWLLQMLLALLTSDLIQAIL